MFKNIGTGLLAIVGIIAAIAAVCAIIVSLPIILAVSFIVIKWLAILGLIVGVIWAIGFATNKLLSIKKKKGEQVV